MSNDSKTKSFRELLVWPTGIELTKAVDSLTLQFPAEEKSGLVSQLRSAAVSVPSKIADGQARRSSAEFSRFLSVSLGSPAELETQLIAVQELRMSSVDEVEPSLAFTNFRRCSTRFAPN